MLCDKCIHAEKCPAKAEHGGAIRCSAFKPQEMTNEEWLRQASTEELAEELLEHFMWGTTVNAEECFTKEYISRIKKHIMEWLKEVHNDGKH